MKPPAHAFLRVFLPQQGQRADGLHDVVFHAGRRAARSESPGQATTESDPSPGLFCRHLIETAGKQFGQLAVRADGNQPFGESRPDVLVGIGRRCCAATAPSLAVARFGLCATTAGSNCDSRARIRRRATSGWSFDPQFRSENRFDARALRRLRELHRAMQVADVGQGNGRKAVLPGQFTMAPGESVESRNV